MPDNACYGNADNPRREADDYRPVVPILVHRLTLQRFTTREVVIDSYIL
jgi:hypothetical protein